MPKYNVFDEYIDEDIREKHNIEMTQSRVLFDASNLLSDAMNISLMSQKEISENLGLSKGYVSRLLSGTENISLKNLAKILFMLGFELKLSIKKIVSGKNENVVWADFGKTESEVKVECSTIESSSPWAVIERLEVI